MNPVKDMNFTGKESAEEIIKAMSEGGGFSAKDLADGVKILKEGLNEKGSLRILSFPAAIISTGVRGIIADMCKSKAFDLIITTCGTLDHDIARRFEDYYHGDWSLDDKELHKKGLNRIGNVIAPNESYGEIIEKKMAEILKEIGEKEISTHELCREIGKNLNDSSILYWCYKNKIPVIVPGITDGAVGYQLWQWMQDHKLRVNVFSDETLLSNLVWESKKRGALIIGGGISKHHVIWWSQFKGGLDWAVYVTTAVERDGSLSGALPKEAISWGKISEKAKTATVYADATIALPLMWAALKRGL
ncbi:MAG: deoxyhypusine synthase [Candidatus Aenigmarchaeota archaeon]|nr:deoxyhypusine synthase [Candidatus Aenigmarchaeota archaeon]